MADQFSGATTNVPRVLEYAPACKQLSLTLLAIYLLSFTVTWYHVWWDSIIGIFVAGWGYYAVSNTNAKLNDRNVRFFHYGTIISLISHAIALGVVIYYLIEIHLVNDVINLPDDIDNPGWTLFVFLLIFLSVEIIITAMAMQRTYNLCAELTRNEYFHLGGGRF